MDRSTKRRSEAGDVGLATRYAWSSGSRARVSDRPWRPRQNGLDSQPTTHAGQQVGREDADG
jgi:hypothetical protein